MSAAGEGLTEPHLNFHFLPEMKMQTSLVTQFTKSIEYEITYEWFLLA